MCKPPKNISPFKYNTDGQLNQKITSEGITTYSYNTQGNLTKVVTPTNTIEYILNPLDQRVAKKVVLMTQSSAVFQTTPVVPSLQMQRNLHLLNALHLWADLTTLLATLDANNNIIQRYNYTDSRVPTSLTQDNQTYYLHYDQVGTLKAISDTNHNIVKEITYDTYGNILNDSNPNFKVPFGFAGGLQDQDTQLVHFGYREYDPYTGKWTTKDPIDFNGGDSNLYGYVLQDPVNLVDVNGLWSLGFDPLTGIPTSAGSSQDINNVFTNQVIGIYGGAAALTFGGALCLAAPEAYWWGMTNPEKAFALAEITNDIFNPSMPPSHPLTQAASGLTSLRDYLLNE